MANSVATTSLSSNAPGTQYDVFLSFRGSDIRKNFKGHLYKALNQKGIHTFVDDNLGKGTEIPSALITAIRKSKISIIIFFKHYAYSRWCLDELVEILKCQESRQQLVWPVFFNVSPSEVRNHTGNFGTALDKYEKSSKIKYKEKLPNWKAALTKAANLSGWHLSKGEDESQLVQRIVEYTLSNLDRKILHVASYPVNVEVEVNSLIRAAKKTVSSIGTFVITTVRTLHTISIYKAEENKKSIHGEKIERKKREKGICKEKKKERDGKEIKKEGEEKKKRDGKEIDKKEEKKEERDGKEIEKKKREEKRKRWKRDKRKGEKKKERDGKEIKKKKNDPSWHTDKEQRFLPAKLPWWYWKEKREA